MKDTSFIRLSVDIRCCGLFKESSDLFFEGVLRRRREAFSRTENTEISNNSVLSVPPWFDPGYQRFRPYVSCDETQSSEEMAAASEISPASATPATISANFCTLPRP